VFVILSTNVFPKNRPPTKAGDITGIHSFLAKESPLLFFPPLLVFEIFLFLSIV